MPRILLSYPDIDGDSIVPKFEKLIVCTSMDMGTASGGAGVPEYGTSYDSDVTDRGRVSSRSVGIDSIGLSKELDCASAKLFGAVFTKPKAGTKATLYFLRPSQPTDTAKSDTSSGLFMSPFLEIEMTDVHVTKYDLKAGGGDNERCEEQISLGFTTLTMKYYQVVDGKKTGFISQTISVAKDQ